MRYLYDYPRPAVTVDMAAFRSMRPQKDEPAEWHVLLVKRKNDPFKDHWALPGGYVNENETLEAAAIREFKEEVQIEVQPDEVRQVEAFGNPGRDPRGWTISVAFFTVLKDGTPRAADDAKEARWCRLSNLPTLAFDHAEIILSADIARMNFG